MNPLNSSLRLPRSIQKLAVISIIAVAVPSRSDDWPQWRGPNHNGISAEKTFLTEFPGQGPAIAWKTNVGLGFSSFVVGNGKAYTAGHDKGSDTVFCFDAFTGKEIWKNSYPAELGDKFFEGGTTGSPTLDEGNHVYWLSRWGDLFCFKASDGKVVWSRQLVKTANVHVSDWGFTGSPTVYKSFLILNVGEAGMAVDKETGKEVWKSNPEGTPAYNTPLVVTRDSKTEAWFGNFESYLSVDPETGKENWLFKWLTQYGLNAADPIPYGDKVFVSTGYGKGAALVKPTGDLEHPEIIWKNRTLRTQLNAAILVDKHLYGPDGDADAKGELKCLNIETGKQLWAFPDFGTGGLIVADHKIIALSARGELLIAPVSVEAFKPTARAQILGGKSWTAPVLANGIVYCRNSRGDIVAVDLRKK